MSKYLVEQAIEKARTAQKAKKIVEKAEAKVPPVKAHVLEVLRPDAFTKRANEQTARGILQRIIEAVKKI